MRKLSSNKIREGTKNKLSPNKIRDRTKKRWREGRYCATCRKPKAKKNGYKICNACISIEFMGQKEAIETTTVKKKSKGIAVGPARTYNEVCFPCESRGLQKCDHCKKPGCVSGKKRWGRRQVCDSCARQDSLQSSKKYRLNKAKSVLFADKKKSHNPNGETMFLEEFKRRNENKQMPKSVHYTHPQNALKSDSLPSHHYTEYQFYNRELMTAGVKDGEKPPGAIGVLADKEFSKNLSVCYPMCNFLKKIADTGKAMLPSPNAATDSTLGAAVLHVQDIEEAGQKTVTAYAPHKDKTTGISQFVMFYQLSGVSFTFIAVGVNMKTAAHVDPAASTGTEWEKSVDRKSQGWQRYEEWKAHSNKDRDMLRKVETFEKDFLKQAAPGKNDKVRVEVYELREGQSLCFAADCLLHGSIITAQVGRTRRALLVFHELIGQGAQTSLI
jgi:hypothetical protein